MQFGCVQAPTAPFMAFVLEPLIDGGFLRAFHCDLDLTRHALYHERVCRVHITGSDRTHDVIAWGTGVRGRPPPLPPGACPVVAALAPGCAQGSGAP